MTDLLVVVGSVTAAQYGPACLQMLEKQLRPRVVRIKDEDFLFDDLDDDRLKEHKSLSCTKGKGGLVEPCRSPVASVRGLIMPETIWLNPDNALNRFPDDFTGLEENRYVVRSDGSVELV